MAIIPVKGSDIPEEQALFMDMWDFLKRYYNITKQDVKSWESATNEATELYAKYKDTSLSVFAKDTIIAVLDYLEQMSLNR